MFSVQVPNKKYLTKSDQQEQIILEQKFILLKALSVIYTFSEMIILHNMT